MKVRQRNMLDKNKEYMGYCPEEQELMPGYIIEGEFNHVVSGVEVQAYNVTSFFKNNNNYILWYHLILV